MIDAPTWSNPIKKFRRVNQAKALLAVAKAMSNLLL
jgi:hypothetical protein